VSFGEQIAMAGHGRRRVRPTAPVGLIQALSRVLMPGVTIPALRRVSSKLSLDGFAGATGRRITAFDTVYPKLQDKESVMKPNRISLAVVSLLCAVGVCCAQNIANGNRPLNMDVNEMDANHDGMITKAEFAAYGEKIWTLISHGKSKVRVETASTDFATGNMSMKVNDMDTNHDGFITHAEFIAYGSKMFDKVKSPQGDLSLQDATKYFASGGHAP
jgi:hypothetical protein